MSWNKNYETTVALLPFSLGQYGVDTYRSDLNDRVKMFLAWLIHWSDFKNTKYSFRYRHIFIINLST